MRSRSPPEDNPDDGTEAGIDVGSQLWRLLREGGNECGKSEGRVGEGAAPRG